jgi:hypothetical protein
MTLDRALCAICAWRGTCNKKFMLGSGVYCPDYTKDVSIRDRGTEKKVAEKPKSATEKPKSAKGKPKSAKAKRKKATDFHIL